MIYVATLDMADEDLGDHVATVCRAFGFAKSGQFLAVPPPNVPVVLLAAQDGRFVQGDVDLRDFEHPETCCYLFGASHGQQQPLAEPPIATVYIPILATWSLFASQAIAIVLYDRLTKGGDFG